METLYLSESQQERIDRTLPIHGDDSDTEKADARYLTSFIRGMAVSQMIGVICEAGLPNALPEEDSHPIPSLASKLGVNSQALLRICRALSAFGFFKVDAMGRIAHNSRSRMLRHGHHPSQHWAARFWTSPSIWQAWGDLRHSLQSGSEAFKHANQRQFFDYMHDHEVEAETYRQYMAGGYPGRHQAIASMLQPPKAATIIDVGGGTGALIRVLLERNPGISGVVYDQPEVVRSLGASPMNGRMATQTGNFFESVPSGGDIYILSWVLHDWPNAKALEILRACKQAMTPTSRLIIIERLMNVNPAQCAPFDLLLDINMLVLHEGQERTQAEFDALLLASGLTPLKLLGTQPNFSVFETTLA